jgi:hypothetical protein
MSGFSIKEGSLGAPIISKTSDGLFKTIKTIAPILQNMSNFSIKEGTLAHR